MECNILIFLCMNNRLLFIILALMPFTLIAQEFTVYSVIGNACVVEKNVKKTLTPRKMLKSTSVISVESESAITILDEHNSKMYSFTEVKESKIADLVRQKKYSSKDLSRQYMNYLIKKLFTQGGNKMVRPDTYMQAMATAYRSENRDSMLLNRIVSNMKSINSIETSTELALADPQTIIGSDLNVSFELISCETGEPLDNNVSHNASCYVRVHNGTDKMLYMTVLNIDSKGNKCLVLPLDAALTCSHLLVPPMSMISFKSEPIIFGNVKSRESFLLVATEEPLDFSILMSPIKCSGSSDLKTGLYRVFHSVN